MTTRRCDRKVLLRIPRRHEIRGPASLLVGKEAEFNQVGLFSTHKCAPALRACAAQTGTLHLVAWLLQRACVSSRSAHVRSCFV